MGAVISSNASKIASVLICALMLAACGLGSKERVWHEQVRLSDGRVVEVERRERYRSSSEWGGPGDFQRLSTELRMTLAPGQELPVLKIGDGKVSEVPIIMDVVDGSAQQFFAVTILDHEDQIKA